MISMKNVYKSYGKKEVLTNTNLLINKGDFVYITGESGCGKSTVIKILTKQEDTTHGHIQVGKIDITSLKKTSDIQAYRRQIGIVFQDYQLIEEMTTKDNLKFVLEYLGWKKKDILPKIKSVASELGIEHLLDKKVSTLSGGEQQKIAIARAIINDPKIIFADEPTGNLDSKAKYEVIKLLEKINRERRVTVVIVTHDNELINSDIYDVYTINNGRLINKVYSVG